MLMNKPQILPALKDIKWEFADQALCRILVSELESPNMPWVAFGYDHPHTFEFLNRNGMGDALAIDDLILLENEALENLRQRDMHWQEVGYERVNGETLRFLVCDDDFLAAERIIDPDFMQEAHFLLQTSDLLVGIPRRGVLITMDGSEGERAQDAFLNFVSLEYQKAESSPITPVVFRMINGIIVGCLNETQAYEEESAKSENSNQEIFVNVVRLDKNSMTNGVYIFVGGHNIQRLAQAIQQSFMETHRKLHLGNDQLCTYRIVPIPGLIPSTEAFRLGMSQLERHLQALGQELNHKYDLPPSKIEMVWGISE